MNILPRPKVSLAPYSVFGIAPAASASRIMIATALLLWMTACDPAFRYQPVGWEQSQGGTWEYANEDLQLVMLPPGGIAGSTWLAPEPEIENRTAETIAIGEVTLESRSITYQGKIAGSGGAGLALLPPGGKRRVAIFFDFNGPVSNALAEEVVLTIHYRIGGGQLKKLAIPLEKTR